MLNIYIDGYLLSFSEPDEVEKVSWAIYETIIDAVGRTNSNDKILSIIFEVVRLAISLRLFK